MTGEIPQKNLTGGQIQEIMDTLLYSALEPLILRSNIFDSQLVYLLGVVTRNKKRKVCLKERTQALDIIAKALITEDPYEKLELIRSLGLERNMIHVFISKLHAKYRLDSIAMYEKFIGAEDAIEQKTLARRLLVTARSLECETRSDLFVILTASYDPLKYYFEYVSTVVNDYVKLCGQLAVTYVNANSSNNYDVKDVTQNFLRNVAVALNKYSSDKGALTSYIKWWIYNAQTCASAEHEYGIAYILPQGQKRKTALGDSTTVNFSVSMDAIAGEDDEESPSLHAKMSTDRDLQELVSDMELSNRVKYLAKHADFDFSGLARLTMDIGEAFGIKELKRMQKSMLKQRLL